MIAALRLSVLLILLFFCRAYAEEIAAEEAAADFPLDHSLELRNQKESPSEIFLGFPVVQKKVYSHENKYLFNPYLSMDFSDAPFTMYGLALDFGKSISSSWDVYFSLVPAYLNNERGLSKKVKQITLANGQQATIDIQKASSLIGVEADYIMAYGKDSWGRFGNIKSESFVNMGIGSVQYQTDSGLRGKLTLGKTFFISPHFNMRLNAGGAILQIISSGQKVSSTIGLVEAGLVYYF